MRQSRGAGLFFALTVFLMFFPAVIHAQAASASTITIESADRTEYRKNPATGYEEIVLTGAVSISVSQGSTRTTITASSITYTRATDMLFAQGGVTLRQTGSSAGEQNITADTLLFNTSTLEGVFDNGRVIQTETDAINLPSGSTLIVASDIFGRDSSGTISFKNAELTFCDDPDPHWKIWASRIWLLPGGEFAFANAVFFVGRVPLLWLPAFYYPKDDFVFNPSFGYDERKGYFFQTTTYILGRKPLDTGSSSGDDDITAGLFNFMKSSTLKEQRREGLVLHNLDEDYTGDTSRYVKVMADYYTTLGAVVGAEAIITPSGFIKSLEASLSLGFSNTVFRSGSGGQSYYVPMAASGKTYYDTSDFLGLRLPFRYGADISISLSRPFDLTLSLPIYSDPYFTDDFSERSEYLDWIGFLLNSEDDNDTTNTITSFTWSAGGSYTVPLPDVVKPYVSSLSLSNFSSSIVFSSSSASFPNLTDEQRSDSWSSYTPQRMFYYPSQVVPFKISGRISGTLVDISSKKSAPKSSAVNFPMALNVPEYLKDEADKTAEESQAGEQADGAADEEEKEEGTPAPEEPPLFSDASLPELSAVSAPPVVGMDGISYSLTYSINPQLTSQINYDSSGLRMPQDFSWHDYLSTYYQIKSPVVLTSSMGYRGTFLSLSNAVTFSPVYQAHPQTNGAYYSQHESTLSSLKKSDFNASQLDLTNANRLSFRPFLYTEHFKNTGLDWNTSVHLVNTKFLGDAEDWQENPQWRYITVWDYLTSSEDIKDMELDDLITAHTLSGTFAVTEGPSFSQTLTLTTTLPPQKDKYDASLRLAFPYLTMSFASGVDKTEKDDTITWTWDAFQQSATLRLFEKSRFGALSLTESLNYQIEDAYWDSFKVSLSWNNIQFAYTMSYTYPYDFDDGWVQRSEKEFIPYSLSLAYSSPSRTFYQWRNRIKIVPALSTSVVYDFVRPTSSYFKFVPALTFSINEFFNLTFSAESRNNVIFRYVQDWFGYEDVISGEKNIFVDLYNSFAFWGNGYFYDPDQTKRKGSGFKLKSLNITVTHDVHDWDLNATLSFKPRLETDDAGMNYYNYHPYFTLSVVWRPMSALKTEIVDDYGEWKLNP